MKRIQKLSAMVGCASVALCLQVSLNTLIAYADFPVTAAVGPDANHDLLIDTILSAKKTLTINVYEFQSRSIADAVIDRIQAGVTTRILIEGQPVRGIAAGTKAVISRLQSEMKASGKSKNFLAVMRKGASGTRRFTYDHAKYVVVDGQASLVTSDNFTVTGHAEDGTVGNRGWDVVVEDPSISSQLSTIFAGDANPKNDDITTYFPITASTPRDLASPNRDQSPKSQPKRVIAAHGRAQGDASSVTLITSPHSQDDLVKLVGSATDSVELEFMSLPPTWKSGSPSVVETNPLVAALVDAGDRGVSVRVLLNDESVFGGSSSAGNTTGGNDSGDGTSDTDALGSTPPAPVLSRNEQTAAFLIQQGVCNGTKISAKIVDIDAVQITYIHNKGIIVDNERTLVSSINGTQNSMTKNRETALIVESPSIASYFRSIFDFDWKSSPKLRTPKTCKKGGTAIASSPAFDLLSVFSN